MLQPSLSASENTGEVQAWLENYRRERQDKTPGKINILAPTLQEELHHPHQQQQPQYHQPQLLHQQQHHYQPQHTSSSNASNDENSVRLEGTPVKKPKSKRTLVSELEQENVPHHKTVKSFPSPQRPLSFNPTSATSYMPQSPIRSPLRACAARPRVEPSPGKQRSLLQDRLVASPAKKHHHLLLSSPIKSTMQPKKRWLKTVFQEQMQSGSKSTTNSSSSSAAAAAEVLARPISWDNENENNAASSPRARSPKSYLVAAALVELRDHNKAALSPTSADQPLNLSMSSSS